MILILEIVLLVFGIMALVKKEWSIGKGRKVIGGRAQILGAIACAILPTVFIIAFAAGLLLGLTGNANGNTPMLVGAALEIGIVVIMCIVLVVLGGKFYKKQEEEQAQQAAMAAQAGVAQTPVHPQGQPIPGQGQEPNGPLR